MLGRTKSLLVGVILISVSDIFGQSHKMPEPGVYSTTNVLGPPPPYGLPLPIDDYLPLLLLAGLVYGAVKMPKLKKN